MAVRDIRVTFFYADEDIWDYVKKKKIRDRVVKWADEFYSVHKYDFKIDHTPIPYNEKLYKKKFSLSTIKGFVADNVDLEQLEAEVNKKRKEVTDIQALRRALGSVDMLGDGDKLLWMNFASAELQAKDELGALTGKYLTQLELKVRYLIHPFIKSLNSPKERLPVVFCWFGAGGVGFTPPASRFFWATSPIPNRYNGTFVLIGVNNVVERNENVLAHEIGHAAGCVHQDTPRNNLMREANDDTGKKPVDLIMVQADLTRLGLAPFVI